MSDELTPVMVLNPYTTKLVNVEPLFRFIRERNSIESVDDIIKYLTQVESSDESLFMLQTFDTSPEIFYFMYMLKDMFQELTECEISLPKKKGVAS